MKRIVFATFSGRSDLNHSDALVVPILAKMGVSVEAKAWDDRSVNWQVYDAVILRSCWDYHLKLKEFQKWIQKLHTMKVRVWNEPDVVIFNTNKAYLFELKATGVRIVPSILFSKMNLNDVHRARQWRSLVVKPIVGASASGIRKFSSKPMFLWVSYLWYLLFTGPVIVQEYVESVEEGEYSLIFFDKKYSHAVKKIPKVGDFRSQEDFGGRDISVVVPKSITEQAKRILDFTDEPLLYARVDGLVMDEQFYLMELELTEPYLFLEKDPQAPKRFADAIRTWLYRYKKQ